MAVRQRSPRDNGFLLAEWLAGVFLCSVLSSGLYMGITAYESSMAITQLKGAAREFAQDLMDIRARALAGSDSGFLVVSSGRKGYWVYRRPNLVVKSRDFASAGTGFLQFSSVPAYIIRFSINGSPSASGKFVLKHNRIPSAQIHINLQPVTGRIRTEHVRL